MVVEEEEEEEEEEKREEEEGGGWVTMEGECCLGGMGMERGRYEEGEEEEDKEGISKLLVGPGTAMDEEEEEVGRGGREEGMVLAVTVLVR